MFSLKCFISSMLALYIAFSAGLPRPFWAWFTAYVIAAPFSGAVRSKAVYRLGGTIMGAGATVLIVPRLANAPELMSLALAGWVGICLYISLLDRTPRSYVFMLAGYTASVIGFGSVSDPSTVFDTGLARVEEIAIGILATALIHSLVFPKSVGPALLVRLDRALDDARQWLLHALRPAPSERAQPAHARLALASEIGELRIMATHLPFDTSHLRWTARIVSGLHDRLIILVPLLLAVEDRLQTLDDLEPGALNTTWKWLLEDVATWIQAGNEADPGRAAHLRRMLHELTPELHPHATWSDILHLNLSQRLDQLIEAFEGALEFRGHLSSAMRGAAPALKPGTPYRTLHRDHGMALRSALAAIIAILLCCAFWIITAWPSGGQAPTLAAIYCCVFATQDDPVPVIKMFVKYMLLSVPVGAVYILLIMPALHSFEMLTLALAPMCLVIGIYMGRPSTWAQGFAFVIGVVGMLSLQDIGALDMTSFTNGTVAQLFGSIAAAVVTAAMRSVNGHWMVRRMLTHARRDMAHMTLASTRAPIFFAAARMVDRIGLLIPRMTLAHLSPESHAEAIGELRELRAGLHVAELREQQKALDQFGVSLQPLFEQLEMHFKRNSSGALPSLLNHLDAALRAVCLHANGQAGLLAVTTLASMRRDLFPRATAYQPSTPERKS
ncbi:FUSC family protein [Janthinobacterium sp.]|uniref:FUSC family protein n=1 Tax=Janthinobacterium sp. TaxID=1871054 RepID=UPI0028970057|nr:FUSC family protein [Janthinobacterium sp.]